MSLSVVVFPHPEDRGGEELAGLHLKVDPVDGRDVAEELRHADELDVGRRRRGVGAQ